MVRGSWRNQRARPKGRDHFSFSVVGLTAAALALEGTLMAPVAYAAQTTMTISMTPPGPAPRILGPQVIAGKPATRPSASPVPPAGSWGQGAAVVSPEAAPVAFRIRAAAVVVAL